MHDYTQIRIEKRHRHWAVYDGPDLVCLTVYKAGALEVKKRLEKKTTENLSLVAQLGYGTSDSSPSSINTVLA